MLEVTLPHGFRQNGIWRHSLWLRPWNGHDELLAGNGTGECPAARATVLLARCTYLGRSGPPATPAFVKRLTAGDRDALLLHLRRVTIGNSIACVWRCERCGEAMELELEIEKLIGPPGGAVPAVHERTFSHGSVEHTVRFRVPNGGDLEAAARVAQRDVAEAERLVLARCIAGVTVGGERREQLPEAVIPYVCEAMKKLDPQAELLIEAVCGNCGHRFGMLCDAAQLVFREMDQRQRSRDREVHLLAYHYHWSESEILSMTGPRRERYAQILLESLDRRRG